MKKVILLIVLLVGIQFVDAKQNCKRPKKLKEQKLEIVSQPVPQPICPPIPEGFYQFYQTSFIDFRSLREGKKGTTFSFRDSLCSPLRQDLIETYPYGMRNGIYTLNCIIMYYLFVCSILR